MVRNGRHIAGETWNVNSNRRFSECFIGRIFGRHVFFYTYYLYTYRFVPWGRQHFFGLDTIMYNWIAAESQLWTESKFWLVGQVINWLSSAVHLLIWHLGFHLFDDDISKSLNLERKPFYLKQNHKGESRDRIHKFANSICQSTKLAFNFLYLHQKLPRNSQLNQILKNNPYQNKF